MANILLLIFYLVAPVVIIHFGGKYLLLKKAGNVLISYILGIIIGNIGIIPKSSAGLQEWLVNITIPLALPLLLMSLNMGNWGKMAKKTFMALATGVAALLIVIIVSHFIFKGFITDQWRISGMLVGVYTGGTPNMASLKAALNVSSDVYILTHTSDLIISAGFLLFLMTIGKVWFKKFLPFDYFYRGRFGKNEYFYNTFEDYSEFFERHNLVPTLKAFGASVLILLIGGGVSAITAQELQVVAAILIITTLGIFASFVPELRRGPRNFELGMYFILVFSLVVSSQADFSKFTTDAIPIFLNVLFVVVFSLAVHVLLAKIFKIDSDTVIIASTALICSPPFVPLVAGSLNNKNVIVSGLTIGIVGYAIGNYLGAFMGFALR